MSKRSKKNPFHKQLEGLFSDLEQDAELQSLATEAGSQGWVWECDPQGVYTHISPEISGHLGLKPAVLLGQNIQKTSLQKASGKRIEQALQAGSFPIQIAVTFIAPDDSLVKTNLHILTKRGPDNEISAYHGFAEVLTPTKEIPAIPEPVEEEAPPVPVPVPITTPADPPAERMIADTKPLFFPEAETEEEEEPAMEMEVEETVVEVTAEEPEETASGDALPFLGEIPEPEKLAEPAVEFETMPEPEPVSFEEPETEIIAEQDLPGIPASLEPDTDSNRPVVEIPRLVERALALGEVNMPRTPEELLRLVDDDPSRVWTDNEKLLALQVTGQLALAVENASLFQQTQTALAETDVLYQASAEINAAESYQEVIDVLRRYTLIGEGTSLVAFNEFNIPWERENQPEWINTLYRWADLETDSERPRIRFDLFDSPEKFLSRAENTYIYNIATDPRLDDFARDFFGTRFQASSAIFIPVVSGNDWHGFVDAFFTQPQSFGEEEIRRLNSIAVQVTQKLITLNLNSRVNTRRNNADRLNQLARQMAEILSEEDLRHFVIESIYNRVYPKQISLYLWDESKHHLQLIIKRIGEDNEAQDEFRVGHLIDPEERPDLYAVFYEGKSRYIAEEWIEDVLHERFMIPFLSAEKINGVVELYHQATGEYLSELDQEMLEGIVLQAGSAIERARLFEQTQSALSLTDEQARRLRILNDLSAALGQASTLQEIYDITIEKTHDIFPSERVSLTMVTPDKEQVETVAVLGAEGQLAVGSRIPLQGTANKVAMDERRVYINPDTNQDDPGAVRSFMVGPVIVSNEALGTLNIGSTKPDFFQERDTDLMQQLLSVFSSYVDNRQLFGAIQDALSTSEDQARRLASLNQMSEALGRANNLGDVLKISAEYLHRIIPADRSSAAMISPEGTTLRTYAFEDGGVKALAETLPMRRSLSGNAIIENRILVAEDLSTDANNLDAMELAQAGYKTSMHAPLTASGKPIGTLDVSSTMPGQYGQREIALMQSISSIIASTIDNRELFQQIQRRSLQLETSAEVSRIASTILDLTELLTQVANLIQEGFGLYYTGIFMVDQYGEWTGEPNKWAVLQAGTGEAGIQMLHAAHKLEIGGDSMIGAAIANKEARIALDVGEEAVFFRNPNLPETRSEMALPLISRNEALGALTIQSTEEAAFTQEDITALQTMADQLANAIENARLFAQTEERAEELAVLNEMARAFTQTLDVDTVIENTVGFTGRLMDAHNFYLAIFDRDSDLVEFKIFIEEGHRIPPPEPVLRAEMGAGLTEWIINNGKPMLIPENVEDHMRKMGFAIRGRSALSWLGVPMVRGTDVMGVIAVQSYNAPRLYNDHDLDLLSAVANQAAVAINNARLFQQTQARARREQLLREITARVHSSADPDTILRTAVREVSNALGRETTIKLEESSKGEGPNLIPHASQIPKKPATPDAPGTNGQEKDGS